jgi:spermidine synthase
VVVVGRPTLSRPVGALLADPRVEVEVGDVAEVLRSAEQEYDVVLLDVDNGPGYLVHDDNAGLYSAPLLEAARDALRPGGILVTYGDTTPGRADLDVSEIYWRWRSIVGTSMGSPRDLRALLEHLETARWRPVLDRTFPLEQIGAAFSRLDAPERFGKVALELA